MSVHHVRKWSLSVLGAVLLIGACSKTENGGGNGTGPEDPVVTSITISQGSGALDAIGATRQLTATVKDQNGNTMSGVTVTWSSDDVSVATVNASGLVTAAGDGSAEITASADSKSGSVTVTVAQVTGTLQIVTGDAQTDTVGQMLPVNLTVQADDRLGTAVSGATLTFSVTAGGGSVADASITTAADGQGSTQWTLGTVAGESQEVTVSTTGAGSVTFTATAIADAPDSMSVQSGDGQTGAPSAALANPIEILVVDQFGNGAAADVAFQVLTGGGSFAQDTVSTDAAGIASNTWTLGSALGSQSAEATVTGLNGSPVMLSATSAPPPATITKQAGDNQSVRVNETVPVAPQVLVKDGNDNPIQGDTVTFTVTAGGGSVTGAQAVTDANGLASVGSWTVGSNGAVNELTAATGNLSPVVFRAGASGFDIEVRYIQGTNPTAAQQEAFDSAAAEWSRAVLDELADIQVNQAATDSVCGVEMAINEVIDDLVIWAIFEPIDGPFNVVGSGGPCLIRGADNLPPLGIMRFDTDDLSRLEADGDLNTVILHEMGHVLGFGTLWGLNGLLADSSLAGGTDPHFTGAGALAAFDSIGGAGYTGGQKVPVEETGGQGTADAHWRELVSGTSTPLFDTELMTGFLDAGMLNPNSAVTVASLEDLGYTVFLGASDDFTLTVSGPAQSASGVFSGKVPYGDDIVRVPILILDSNGTVIRTYIPRDLR